MATRKQKRVAQLLLENQGMSVGKAMLAAGYASSTSKTPGQNLTTTKGWLESFEEALPDDILIDYHKQGLEAFRETPRISGRDESGAPIYEYVQVPDFHARFKYLDEAYKIKARFAPGQDSNGGNLFITMVGLQDAQGQTHNNTIQVQPTGVSETVYEGNAERIQAGSNSLAPQKRKRQDSVTGSSGKSVAKSGDVLLHLPDL